MLIFPFGFPAVSEPFSSFREKVGGVGGGVGPGLLASVHASAHVEAVHATVRGDDVAAVEATEDATRGVVFGP